MLIFEKTWTMSKWPILIALICAIWFCHYYHLHFIAENDKHFSHLSSLERELSFRSEMAMYYSYFKDLISTSSFVEGLKKITADKMIQYPETVNSLQRFNVYPEVFVAVLYRIYVKICGWMNAPLMECWQVERGGEMPPVTSCEGFGEPVSFYTTIVFFINGFLPVFIFIFGYFLSNSSIFGGLIAASSFFFNHRECTRVMWTPPLRESFAFPFVILQNFLVELCLNNNFRKRKSALMFGLIFCNFILLISWQFSQFAFLTQIFALSFLYGADYFDFDVSALTTILSSHFISLIISAVFLFGNRFLLTSLYAAALLNFVFVLMGHSYTRNLRFPVAFLFRCSLMLAGTFSMRRVLISLVGGVEDDSHILDLLKTKLLPSFRTFHTQLYVCAPEFDFLGRNSVYAITTTLLLPLVILLTARFLFSIKQQPRHLAYHFLQLGAYSIMALFIMRLKLFFTPFLCITASLLATDEGFLPKINSRKVKTIFVAFVFGGMVVMGAQNLHAELAVRNEFANWPLESLVNWIGANTSPRDAFAGAMPTTSAIRLSAGRPIANHPHYEDVSMRNRTLEVYTIYSRKSLSQIHAVFRKLSVSYVVVEAIWCESYRRGCALAELYDISDVENRGKEPACFRMIQGKAEPYFRLVFQKEPYYLLKVIP